MTKQRKIAYLAMLGNTILWGVALPIVKKGFDDGLTPMTFLFWRYVVAVITSLPIVIWIGIGKRRDCHGASSAPRNDNTTLTFQNMNWRRNLLKIVGLELMGTVLALILLYKGLELTGAIEGSLIAIIHPIFVTLGGVWFFKERQEKREWLGMAMAVAGALLLVVTPLIKNGLSGGALGNILILGESMVVAVYYLLAKYNYRNLNKWLVTHISFWVGLIGFGAIQIILGGLGNLGSLENLSFWPVAAIVYMGFAGSVLALTLYLIGQDKIEASEATIFTYLQMAFTIPAAMWLLGEKVAPIEVLALGLIIGGVLYNTRR